MRHIRRAAAAAVGYNLAMGERLRPAPGPFERGSRYNSYGAFLRRKYGCRVGKVSVDAGFTCPNRDGTAGLGGCAYCDGDSFVPESVSRARPVAEQVAAGIEYLRARYRARKFIAYFQPRTNTHAPLDRLVPLYEEAMAHEDIVGLAVGTRPDAVDEDKLAWFEQLAGARFVTLEYGLQSAHDRTLERIRRGHDYACWRKAVERTRGRGIYVTAHLILGFPWESREEMLSMAAAVSAAGVDFLKLHHLHVLRGTAMGAEFERAPFALPSYGEYVGLVVDFLERLDPDVCLERLFALAPEDRLLAPRWGKSKAEMQFDIEQALARRRTWQGRLFGSQ